MEAKKQMKAKKYDKLVRDKIPEIIEEDSKNCIIKKVEGKEKLDYLFKKLFEEAQELCESKSAEEIADVQEVLDSISNELNITKEQLDKIRKQKAESRGTFEKGIVLLEINQK